MRGRGEDDRLKARQVDVRRNLSWMTSLHWASSVPHVKWMITIYVFHASETFSTVMVSMRKVQSATK